MSRIKGTFSSKNSRIFEIDTFDTCQRNSIGGETDDDGVLRFSTSRGTLLYAKRTERKKGRKEEKVKVAYALRNREFRRQIVERTETRYSPR